MVGVKVGLGLGGHEATKSSIRSIVGENMHALPIIFAVVLLATMPFASPGISTSGLGQKIEFQYEYDAQIYERDQDKAKKFLTAVHFYDKRGKVAERWDLINNSAGAYYKRYVNTFDRLGRNVAVIEYESARTAAGTYFSVVQTLRSVKIIPELTEKVVEVSIKTYDRSEDPLQIRTSDADGVLKQRITYTYDSLNRQTGFLNEKGDGSVICSSTTAYSPNGLSMVQSFQTCPQADVRRIDSKKDNLGRFVLEEQFSRSSSEPSELALTSRAATSYKDDIEMLDWVIWHDNGQPTKKISSMYKGDRILFNKEYEPAKSGANDGKIAWILSEEESHEYSFDKAGNVIKEIVRKRYAADQSLRVIQSVERKIIYLR